MKMIEIATKLNSHLLLNINKPSKLVEFIIPKGAKYFIGFDGEIVSTSIRSGSLRSIKA